MESASDRRAPLGARIALWVVASCVVAVAMRLLRARIGDTAAVEAAPWPTVIGDALRFSPWVFAAFSASERWGWLDAERSRVAALLALNALALVAIFGGEVLRGLLADVHDDSRHALATAISRIPVTLCFIPLAWWATRLGAGWVGALALAIAANAATRTLTPDLFAFPIVRDGGVTALVPPLEVMRDSLTPAMGLWGIFTALEMRAEAVAADGRDDAPDDA